MLSLWHSAGRRGRQTAIRLGLPAFGILGVLLQAKRLARMKAVAPELQRIQTNGYRMSQALIDAALKLAGEA